MFYFWIRKLVFEIFLPLFDHFLRFSKFKILAFFCTFWPISKQTADFSKKSFYTDDRLLMLYVLARIVFLYHQWSRWYVEMLIKSVRQLGVYTKIRENVQFWEVTMFFEIFSNGTVPKRRGFSSSVKNFFLNDDFII